MDNWLLVFNALYQEVLPFEKFEVNWDDRVAEVYHFFNFLLEDPAFCFKIFLYFFELLLFVF